jgi:hypothetical protein
MSECVCDNDYLYYSVTIYIILTLYLINNQDKQQAYLKKKLKQEKEMNNNLLELVGLRSNKR